MFMKKISALIGVYFAMNTLDVSAGIQFSPPTPLYSCGYGQGQGTFQALDLDGDKKLDIIQYECIALGNGDGTFRKRIVYPGQEIVAAADFDLDGTPAL